MAGEVRRRLDEILDAALAAFPSQGRDLGLHAYDGLVDDLSPPRWPNGPPSGAATSPSWTP